MAPGGVKRKRPERQTLQDDGAARPSPHRPEDLELAQQDTSIADETPKEPVAPFYYDFVTDTLLQEWTQDSEGAKANALIAATQVNELAVITVLEELVRSSLDNRLEPSQAGRVIRKLISHYAERNDFDIQSDFLNILSLLEESDARNPHLLALVTATNIAPEIIRQELDIPMLQALSLVRSSFTQKRTRKTTNLLYRQANFNLLREETEGYAKLITDHFNTASEAVHSQQASAEDAFQKIMALVGSFDLDVGRVLDITLDISANLLVRAYGFIVKFYRCSSWWPSNDVADKVEWEHQGFGSFPQWALPKDGGSGADGPEETLRPIEAARLEEMKEQRDVAFWHKVRDSGITAFFEIGARKICRLNDVRPLLEQELEPELDARGNEINADRRNRLNEDRRFMRETGMLPPPGNSDAAQLLGFKLRFYASDAREEQDILPENLIYLAALLIKIGFISLRDLYPHLHPSDDNMPAEKARLEKEKNEKLARERPGGGANALVMAGTLPDDTHPRIGGLRNEKERSGATTPKHEKKDDNSRPDLPAPTNQKLLLLKALLLIGALPEALYILSRFPWLLDVDLSLASYLHRIAKRMLNKIDELSRPMRKRHGLSDPKQQLQDTTVGPDGTLRFKQGSTPKVTRWLGLDKVDETDGQSYRHYYPDWDDNVPICQDVDDVFALCNSFLGLLGVKIGQDAELLSTLVRIAKHSLGTDDSESNRSRWLELMKRLLVPSLSLTKHNPGITQEIYELLKSFPTATRYNIYAEWYFGKTSRLPDMRTAFDRNRAEIKDVLRRVTNETSKKQSKALAKVALSSPGIVATMMINQLESYSNMIPSLVECVRHFSFLAYDVLSWCLVNSLSGQGRSRIQSDGMLTSPWLQALSQFVASLFTRYSIINPSPVLQYLAYELRTSNSTDLEMLEQVLVEMAGIRAAIEFNDAQVLAMAGGEQLQTLIVQQLADKRHIKGDKARRLIRALGDYGLTGQLLISIAQERRMYAHHESSQFMPLKVLGNNLDKIQHVFAQYLEVLRHNLNPTEFADAVPNIISLVGEFGLSPGLAFTVYRKVVAHRIAEHDAAMKQGAEAKKRKVAQDSSKAKESGSVPENSAAANDDLEEGEAAESSDGAPTPAAEDKPAPLMQPSASQSGSSPWHPVLKELIHELPEVASHLESRCSIPFFVTFWTLTLQDVLVHTASYDVEMNKLKAQLKELSGPDRAKLSTLAQRENDRKRRGVSETQDRLREELKGRIAKYQKTRNRLSRQEKDHWFPRVKARRDIDARHIGLLQECFLPRAMLSSLDAHYCFLMLKILHENGTPGFSTMHLLNQLFKKHGLAAFLFQCTAVEAQHFGRFLCEILKLLQHWHAAQLNYEKEGLGGKQKLPGFAKKADGDGEPADFVSYEDFRRLLFNWHSFLTGALQICFESEEYMHIRNGIIVLRSVVNVFPALNFHGTNMVKQIGKISEKESREDLKLAATSLLGFLKSREKKWIMPQAFRLNDPAKDPTKGISRPGSTGSDAPPRSSVTPKLDVSAPESKPNGTPLQNGVGKDRKERKDQQGGEKQGDVEMKDVTDSIGETPSNSKRGPEKAAVNQPGSRGRSPAPQAKGSTKPPSIPTKPPPSAHEGSRPSSTQPSRNGHALPTRPDAHTPGKPLAAPSSERTGRQGGRSDDKYGRLDRPTDAPTSSKDHSPPRSRGPTRDRTAPAHSGSMQRPPRDDRAPVKSVVERYPYEDSRNASRRDQSFQAASHRPPYDSKTRSNDDARPSGAPVIPDSTVYHENPARMALINENDAPSRSSGREYRKDASSTVRASGGRNALVEQPPHHADRSNDHAPTGPRLDRQGQYGGPRSQESSYGRLNGPHETSSAPRTPNHPTRGAWGGNAQHAPVAPSEASRRTRRWRRLC